jgi:hypothetical protein
MEELAHGAAVVVLEAAEALTVTANGRQPHVLSRDVYAVQGLFSKL